MTRTHSEDVTERKVHKEVELICGEAKEGEETNMSQLMDKILSRENMLKAYKKVKSNKGAGGIDLVVTIII